MNINIQQGGTNPFFVGNQRMLLNRGLKSTQERLERQQKCNNQIAYWEEQKKKLKETENDSLEGIARKLSTLQDYEDEIAAAKEQYNHEQMWHLLDEAREMGEKIAKAAEKFEPKTAEERLEEMAEEALETDDTDEGALAEAMEELEELEEEMAEESKESLDSLEEYTEELEETTDIESKEELKALQEQREKELQQLRQQEEKAREKEKRLYAGFDIRI